MNLEKYNTQDLLLAAIKSEIDSKTIYTKLAGSIRNDLIKDKLLFLATEEAKHQQFIETMFIKQYPNKRITIPKKTVVPLPTILDMDENTPLSKIVESAMNAEHAAQEFYKALAKQYKNDSTTQHMLQYFSDMELQHYKILEVEKESMERFEQADVYWPMVHAGP